MEDDRERGRQRRTYKLQKTEEEKERERREKRMVLRWALRIGVPLALFFGFVLAGLGMIGWLIRAHPGGVNAGLVFITGVFLILSSIVTFLAFIVIKAGIHIRRHFQKAN